MAKEHKKITRKPTSLESQEEIYKGLNTLIQRTLKVITLAFWPFAVLLLLVGSFLGFNLWDIRDQMSDKLDKVNDIAYSIQEERIAINKTQEDLKIEQQDLRDKIQTQVIELDDLKQRTVTVTEESDHLLTDIQVGTRELLDRAEEQIEDQNRFLEDNKAQIEKALQGINEKEKLLEDLKNEQDKALKKIEDIAVLFTEYNVLLIKGRSSFPDPNLKRESEILNEITQLLFENPKDRSNFIHRMNSI